MLRGTCIRKSATCKMESAKCNRDGRFRAQMAGDARGMASFALKSQTVIASETAINDRRLAAMKNNLTLTPGAGAGAITYDGKKLNDVGLAIVRAAVGTVMQEDRLFAGSVAENSAFFDDHIDRERIRECARMANIHEEILEMPLAYETLVGDMGSSMSGGQRQRILLARALYKNPSMLLLDEATNHLDEPSELKINMAIKNLGITRIIIAHRPATINSAHRVIELVGGRVNTPNVAPEDTPVGLRDQHR